MACDAFIYTRAHIKTAWQPFFSLKKIRFNRVPDATGTLGVMIEGTAC
jgi:hypothetical protein